MSKFTGSYSGIGQLLCADFIEADMLRRAEKVRAAAEAAAPVSRSPKDRHRGRYKASFQASAGIREGKSRRACGRVVNTAPEARFVEFGAKGVPRYRTLGNALMAARD